MTWNSVTYQDGRVCGFDQCKKNISDQNKSGFCIRHKERKCIECGKKHRYPTHKKCKDCRNKRRENDRTNDG